MGLPIALDHINLWAIADEDGWTIIDSGINHSQTIKLWERILSEDLNGRPVKRVIATHMHADHVGFAGWLIERFACKLWMTRSEYLFARILSKTTGDEPALRELYEQAGWQTEEIAALGSRKRKIASFYTPLPGSIHRLRDGDVLEIGGMQWTVITGGGHSPEHACLYCSELELFISGDMVLPSISSNISVDPLEPYSDPLEEWFFALDKIQKKVPDNVLVLPSHGNCFNFLHKRIDSLVNEQKYNLNKLYNYLFKPRRTDELFKILFSRQISRSDIPLMSLATGETIALLNHLIAHGAVERFKGQDGVLRYQRIK